MPWSRAFTACCSVLLLTGLSASRVHTQSAGSTEIILDGESTGVTRAQLKGVSFDCRVDTLPADQARACRVARRLEGQRLFEEETFGGNGRTCATCHSRDTGTLSPTDVQARFSANPDDALFRHDAFDDGQTGVTRIAKHATVRIELELPPYVTLKDDPSRRTIVVTRGIPTTLNTPALDKVFMADLRNRTLEEQALGAIVGHAKNTVAPTPLQLELIAEFERESPRFFSSPALRQFANGGPAPQLPAGETESQQRGRAFFVEAPFTKGGKDGLCALCHTGPMLDRGGTALSAAVPGAPVGIRDASALVSERNVIGNPAYTFVIDDGVGRKVEISSPDPGEILTARNLPPPSTAFPRTIFMNFFKIPTLWGVKNTAPYFHDGSAKTLEEVVDQYEFMFKDNPFGLITTLTEQDKKDIVEYLKLLN
jgi:cytochrome c peroxidase